MFLLLISFLSMAADSTVITSHATVEVTATSGVIAALNADRNYLLIQNIGSSIFRLFV